MPTPSDFTLRARSHHPETLLFITLLMLSSGCGTGQYDAVARARIDALRTGALEGAHVEAPEWQLYSSQQNYSVELPGPAKPITQDDGAAMTEQIKVVVGDIAYQVNFIRSNGIDIKAVADQMGKALEADGYKRSGGTARNTKGLVRQDTQFEKADKSSRAMIRVFEFDTARACALSVIGANLPPADVKRFFDSVTIPPQ